MESAERQIRKRRRPMSSCEECRRRKVKCDQKSPCDQCVRAKCEACVYYRFHPESRQRSRSPTKEAYPSPQIRDFFQKNGLMREVVSSEGSPESPPADRIPVERADNNASEAATGSECRDVRELQSKVDHLLKELKAAREAQELPKRQFYANTTALKGVVSKTRLMGRSHFMYVVKQGYLSVVELYESMQAQNPQDSLLAGVEKCKRLGRVIKDKNKWHQPLSSDLKSYVPPREVCDVLLNAYLRTFESVHRVLHVPSFCDEYNKFWEIPEKASTTFMIKFLLVLAIGAAFQHGQEADDELRESARKWIHVAHSWLTFPFTEKQHISLTGVQIHCLLLMAREIMEVGGDMIWLAAGNLVRTANLIGLHRDPSKFPGMTEFQIEMRRRLWATVTEICFQAAMSAGGMPMINLEDSDCLPPRNFDDDQIGESMKGIPIEKDAKVMTQSTVQRLMTESLPIRTRIAAALNNTISETSYAETNRLGVELSQIYQGILQKVASLNDGQTQKTPSAFQLRMLKLVHVGSLGSLHMPFAVLARKDPTYFFSRKTCMDVALSILAPDDQTLAAISPGSESIHDSRCLEIVGGGYFRSLSTICALMIFGELSFQDGSMSMFMSAAESVVRQEMRRAIIHFENLTLDRLKAGERNIKGHLFSVAIRAQLDAREQGIPVEPEILKGLKESLDRCIAVLEARAGSVQTPGSEGLRSEQFSMDNFPADMIPEPFWWDELDFDYQDMNFSRTWNGL